MRTYLFDIHFRAIDTVRLPRYNKGNILRGALGRSLRDLVCPYPEGDCATCTAGSCVYRSFFNSLNPGQKGRLSGNRDIPRPFVFNPPLDPKTVYSPGQEISFGMVIFGRAIDFLPFLIAALDRAADRGFGAGRGRAVIERVVQADPVTGARHELVSCDGVVRPGTDIFFTGDSFTGTEESRVRVNFLTPAVIKDGGRLLQRPGFAAIVRRLRDRYSTLSWFYGGREPDIDFSTFADAAEQVRAVKSDLVFVNSSRRAHSSNRQDLSGFVGSVLYEGPLGQYMPLLKYGQYMHVGKAAVLGNGWYEIENA